MTPPSAPAPAGDGSSLVEALAEAWRRGERPTAAELIDRHPGLDDEAAIRLIYEEVCLRRELGQEVRTSEVVQRYPKWGPELGALFSADRLLRPPPPADFPRVGDRLGDFQILDELGRGASGRTFLAAQPTLADRPVVLKVMPRDLEEHLSLARLQHTHIVPLYAEQVFPERGLRALCMPYLGGTTLARALAALAVVPLERRRGRHLLDVIDQGRKAARDPSAPAGPIRRYLEQAPYVVAIGWVVACLADALQYAHDRGLVHMDVKPSNVLLTDDGQPMLLDFHLARAPVRPGDATPERLGGTPSWMSPEQRAAMTAIADGREVAAPVDGRSDVYSLGLLLREALGGVGPAAVGVPRLDRLNSAVSVGLADIAAKCLAPVPGDRYPDAATLAEDLRRHLNDLPLRGVPNRSLAERLRKWRRRRPPAWVRASAWASTAAAALIVAGLAWTTHQQRLLQIQADLDDGLALMTAHRYPDAIRTLRRGHELAARTPAVGRLAARVDEGLLDARRGHKADELHDLAERVRARYGVETPDDESRDLADRLRVAWSGRGVVLTRGAFATDSEARRQVRADLLDLAVVRADLHVRNATPAARDDARREALAMLDEAEDELGPSLALDRDRRTYAEALGLPAPGDLRRAAPATDWEHDALGRSYLRSGQFERAAAEFRAALALRPDDFWAYYHLGLCAFRLRRFDESLAAYTACVALEPLRADCYYNRALACDALGHADDAARDDTRALELDPNLAAAALNRGILAFKAGRHRDAAADFRRALDLSPAAALRGRALYNLALALRDQGDRPAAVDAAEKAVAAGNADARALLRDLTRP
ncbi:MAG TPA: serine/threonine-protein kinase [Isosphaeraceae bacterium]|jgi:serine/threonine protein kinase/Flp pilus assembly protein TadD|nr:serine/threonine-protein kinase [Isosphaeraceae bacterium]